MKTLVEGRLPAAGLVGRELDGRPGPLQHPHHRLPGSGIEGVNQAGDEELDGEGHGFNSITL